MTKITIEIDNGTVQSTSIPPERRDRTPQPVVTPAYSGASLPADVLAQAAATGAINAGPGPSMSEVAQASAPIASSLGGAATGSSGVVSAGAAPQNLFETEQYSPGDDPA